MKFLIVIINETPKLIYRNNHIYLCLVGWDIVWCNKYSSANNKIDIDGANSDISFNGKRITLSLIPVIENWT
jgi:hypothetical protein